jgi:ribosomal protein S18 acetylase RimI-like enzyme
MIVSEVTDSDIETVIDLWRRCGLTRPWNDPRTDLAQARVTPTSTVLVGHIEDALVASVMVGYDGHRGWVYYLAVAPQAQRGGLGRRMMQAAEAWLRARGAPKLQLMVRNTNAAAIGFYERLGLERQDVVTMGKRLDQPEGPT